MPWRRTLSASVVVLALGVAGLAFASSGFRAFTTQTAERVAIREHPPAVPAAALRSQAGDLTSLAALHGQWLLVDFVYTSCLDDCAVLGADYAQLQKSLAGPLAEYRLHLVSISIDPADTPRSLKAYVRRYGGSDSGWLAARPTSDAALDELERTFGIIAVPDGHGGYTHTAAVDLVSPDGRFVRIVGMDHLSRIPRLVKQALADGSLPATRS